MIGQKGIPAKSGGVERHVEELATRLAKNGHEVFVYCRTPYTPPYLKEYKGVKLINLPAVHTKNLEAITHTFLATLHVLFQKADVVHYHAIGPSSLCFIPRLLKRKTKIVSTFHCQDYYHQKWGFFARAYLRFGEFIALKAPQATIAVSRALQGEARRKYNCLASYLPNAVELPEPVYDISPLKQFGLSPRSYILYVGRLIRPKGVHDLISAYQRLKTDKKLVIVGGASHTKNYVQELKDLAQGSANVLFLGEQTGSLLKALFSQAALYVSPSYSEGLSISLLEAMSYGLPVVASEIKENQEVIKGAGVLFKTHDVADCAQKMEYVLSHQKEADILGAMAKERIKKYYQWEWVISQIEKIYQGGIVYEIAKDAQDIRNEKFLLKDNPPLADKGEIVSNFLFFGI
jgi:glycosyltransferase involved in cell wall biosynthesis